MLYVTHDQLEAATFADASWYMGYVNSMTYVAMNLVITLLVSLPAAYAFSRYKFVGDKYFPWPSEFWKALYLVCLGK
jgi:ABC-type glycerol-3-phosphate transport system permease component